MFKHFLTAAGSLVSIPLLLRVHFCLDNDYVGISELIGTIFVVSGVATLLQTTVGVRFENDIVIIIHFTKKLTLF